MHHQIFQNSRFLAGERQGLPYQLYELYKCIGNTEKASELAKILLEKPAKVNSALIKRIRYMVKKDGLINSVRR